MYMVNEGKEEYITLIFAASIQSTSLAVLATRAASRRQGRKGAVRTKYI